MSKSTNSTIEINGKRYDSQTGKPVSSRQQRSGSVDGVMSKKTKSTALATPRPRAVAQPIVPLSDTKLMDMQAPKRRARTAAQPTQSHQPQASHTLMRHVVKKPGKSLKRQHAAKGHTDAVVIKPQLAVAKKHSVSAVPAARLDRAKNIVQSSRIKRFVPHSASTHLVSKATQPVTPAPKAVAAAKQPIDIFEQALQRATSHEQPAVIQSKHPRRQAILSKRRVSVAATGVTVLALIAVVGFYNRHNLSLRMAASKAGFSASLPGYKPSGFSISKLNYSAGNVAINFKSHSDERAYAVTESPSDWDSATLRDNFVAPADSNFQTVNVAGRIVYLYGKNNAAWVNGGVWYQVKTDGSLSAQQVTDIAASL